MQRDQLSPDLLADTFLIPRLLQGRLVTVLYGLLTAPLLAALLLQLAAALQAAGSLVLAAARPPNILRTVNSRSAD